MEYMPNFRLHRPETVAEAVRLRSEEDNARYLAGGTDMMVNICRGIEAPGSLVDLTAIGELKQVHEDSGGLYIGAGVTLRQLATHHAVASQYPAVAQAAAAVAGPTHQQYGTVGGNLCLDTRCLFYNQSEWWRSSNDYCLKHRGDICHVASGGKRCFAAFSGDVAPAMMVHGAEVEIAAVGGSRGVPLADIYRDDGMDHLALEPGELLATIHLPKATAGASAYEKARVRGSIDFPLAGAAVRLAMAGGKVAELRIALTGVNPLPLEVDGLDKFVDAALDDTALDEIRELVRRQARPMATTTVRPWYRRRVVGALARRLAARLGEA